MAEKLLILYASQTGNAQDVAERIGREAFRRRYSPLVLSMDACNPAQLANSTTAILVAATTGQGDPPDNMRAFWRFLLRKSLPPTCLQHLRYAVFGLGDSGYQKYNIAAKKLDRRLLDLGARPLVPRGLGDDQHPSGYEAALDPWLANLWASLRQIFPLPSGASEPSESDSPKLDPPKFIVTYVSKPARKLEHTTQSAQFSELDLQRSHSGSGRIVEEQGSALVPEATENARTEGFGAVKILGASGSKADGKGLGGFAAGRGVSALSNGHRTETPQGLTDTPQGLAGTPQKLAGSEATSSSPAAASVGGDELEENLRAIAVLDSAMSAGSGQGVATGAGNGAETRPGYSQTNPYLATMVANVRLTSADNEQDVRHIELDLGASGISYAPGDVINVMPENSADVVRRFCERCGLDPDVEVVIEPRNPDSSSAIRQAGLDGFETGLDGEKTGFGGRRTGSDERKMASDGCQNDEGVRHHVPNGWRSGTASGMNIPNGHRNGADGADDPESNQAHGRDTQQLSVNHPRMDPTLTSEVASERSGSEWNALGGAETTQRWGDGIPDSSDVGGAKGFGPVRIGALVRAALDVGSASPRRYFFEVLAHFATAEHEIERLQYFATAEGRDDLYRYNQRERRTVLEVLDDFPSAHLPLEWILQVAPRLKARAFSISSSLLAHPRQTHITVAVVQFQTPYKRTRVGLCSHWLSSLNPETPKPVRLPVWVSKGFLKLPPPSVPMVLIGPGTGCAPFRSFLEERTEQERQSGTAGAPCMFFFGCRREKGDFLYRDQWLSFAQDGGVLSEERGGAFSVAFSRDQMLKVYVTHKIKDQGRRVWQLLQAGASIFVAGSANKMPNDVASALEIVAQREGQMTKQEAAAWLRDLEKSRRYHVEAWS